MAYRAIRGSGAANAVSRLHGQVSRHLFQPLFPGWPENEVPIGYVTNGVHVPTWDSPGADELGTASCGPERWLGTAETVCREIRKVPDIKLWQFRCGASQALVEYVRKRMSLEMAVKGESPDEVEAAKSLFNPNALTLGFARRFATYKRPNLLLHDPERLLRLLNNSERPVQLFIAGKAHPADEAGKALIREWTQFIRRPDAQSHVIFLGDYDMLLTEQLVHGVDVWINTPRRPWEACGTSGMKVLVNGGINVSELDGWWAEACAPEVGWAWGDGQEHGDDSTTDAADADALYGLLEREVIPEFYERDENGVPVAWVGRMRESMARLTPQFSAERAVREYTGQHYLPGAAAYLARATDRGAAGKKLIEWRRAVDKYWPGVRFGDMKTHSEGDHHIFEVQVYLNELDPHTMRVELYADGDDFPVRQEMEVTRQPDNAAGGYTYRAAVPATRPAADFTARVMPRYDGVAVPLELDRIIWQR